MPKNEQIIIWVNPHPKGSAKAVVSFYSAELFVLNKKTISSLSRSVAETILERSDDDTQGEIKTRSEERTGPAGAVPRPGN